MKSRSQFLVALLVTALFLPAQAKDNASPDFVRMLNDLASSFRVQVGSSKQNLDKCELQAGSEAIGMMKGKFVMTAAQATIFDPLTGALKDLLGLLGLGPILEAADLYNAYIEGGASGFVKALAKIILGKVGEAGWDKITAGTKWSAEDAMAMELPDQLELIESYIKGQVSGYGSDATVEMVSDPSGFFTDTLGKDEFANWDTRDGGMGATWDKSTGIIYINVVIRRKCPNPTDLKYGRVQIWGKVKAVTSNGKTSYSATLTRYEIKGVCCGEDETVKYPPPETEAEKKARLKAQKALAEVEDDLKRSRDASNKAGSATSGGEAQEAAATARSEAEKAAQAVAEAEKAVAEAKKAGVKTDQLEKELERKRQAQKDAEKKAGAATVGANDKALAEGAGEAEECRKAIKKCDEEVAAIEKQIEENAAEKESLDKQSGELGEEEGATQDSLDEISEAEKAFRDCEAQLQKMAAEAGVETRQDENGRTHIMGQVSGAGKAGVSSSTWNKLVAKRKECTKAANKLKALKKKQKEAEARKADLAKKRADLEARRAANEAEAGELQKQLAAKKEECKKKRLKCEKKRKALVAKYDELDKADGSTREVPKVLQESLVKKEDPGRRELVRQGQRTLSRVFTALEQENSGTLQETLSEGFVTQDRLALAQGRPQFLQASRLQFENLNGTQYRVDVGPFRVDPSGQTAQVTFRWDQRARFQQSGQEWLLRDQETTAYFEEHEGKMRLLVLQGDPLLRTNDFGVTLVDEGTVDLTPVAGPFGLYSGTPVVQREFLAGFPVDNTATATQASSIQPDLTLRPGSLAFVPGNPQVGQQVNAQVAVANAGASLSPPSQVGVFLNGQLAAQAVVPILSPGQEVPVMLNLNPAQAGNFATQARVDFNNQVSESNEANNAIAGAPLVVSAPAAIDLVVVPGTIQFAPVSPQVNTPMQVTAMVRNAGNTPAPASQAQVAFNGAPVGAQAVPPLAAGQTVAVVFNVQAPPAPGSVPVQVAVDPTNQVMEANEANNLLQGPNLVVQPGGAPDLVLTGVTVNGQAFPAIVNVQANVPFNVQLQVQNVGTAPSGPSDAVVILVRGAGIPLGPVAVPALAQGQTTTVTFQAIVPTAGPPSPTDAMVDPNNTVAESNEGNNGRQGPGLQVTP